MDTSEAGRKGGIARAEKWKGTKEASAASRKGGKARAKKLDPARRTEIASGAAKRRWALAAAAALARKNGTGRK